MSSEQESGQLISKSTLNKNLLRDEVVVVTGAGRGIGYEAAKALLWLGARVILAEINEQTGNDAVKELGLEFGGDRVKFVKTNIGNETDIQNLASTATRAFGKVDAVLNNATTLAVGAVKDTPISSWDSGYHVNLRGPVLLARAFLPDMVKRRHGVFVCVSSSGAAPFMGPYEVFKTAQVELANTIVAEVEGTGVFAFTIGPGIVRTPGFLEGGSKVASMMGITADELVEMNKAVLLTPEEAGVGFAASIALASKYNGTETSSVQVLRDIGIASTGAERHELTIHARGKGDSVALFKQVLKTYKEQSQGWKARNVFQRQWVFRDFKKQTDMSVDEMLTALNAIGGSLEEMRTGSSSVSLQTTTLNKLESYYKHQADLLQGFEKDQKKLEEGMKSIQSWIDEIQELLSSLG